MRAPHNGHSGCFKEDCYAWLDTTARAAAAVCLCSIESLASHGYPPGRQNESRYRPHSIPWKHELRKMAAALERRAGMRRWTERTGFLVERDVMLLARMPFES